MDAARLRGHVDPVSQVAAGLTSQARREAAWGFAKNKLRSWIRANHPSSHPYFEGDHP